MRVKLTIEEVQRCRQLAAARMAAGDIRDTDGGGSPERCELIGVVAEYAVAKRYNAWPESFVYKGRGGPSTDLIIDGRKISVKGTGYFYKPHLIVRDYDVGADVYILVSCAPEGEHAILVGWIYGEQLKEYEPRPFKPGARLSRNVPYEDLNRF